MPERRREAPCWWHAPAGACRASGLVLPAKPALPTWVASNETGRRGFSVCLYSFLLAGEEATRHYTAIAMILKSRAHTATRKFRRRGYCGSTSFTALHSAQIISHRQSTQLFVSFVEGGRFLSLACQIDRMPSSTLEHTTHRLDTGGDVKRQIITPTSCADAGVGKKRKPAGLRVGGEVPGNLPSGNGHDRRENTTSTPTRSVQENSNVRFNFYWEVA